MGAREDLLKLAVEIGPRGAGTAAEEKAASFIRERFAERGLTTSVEEFKTIGTYSYLYIIYLGFAILTAWLSYWFVFAAAPLALVNAALFALDLETYPVLSKLMARATSRNVTGEILSKDGRVGLVITAHYDSSRAALSFHPGLVSGFRATMSLMICCVFASLGLLIANLAVWIVSGSASLWVWIAGIAASAYLLVPLFIMIHREAAMRHTPGANDNASGVAAMLALVDKMSEPESLVQGVMFIATGAEEAGTVGMIEFLKKHGERVRDAFIVNIDNIGSGWLCYIDREGMLSARRSDEVLLWLAGKVVKKKRLPLARCPYRLLSTDATPALARGYRAMSVMAFDDRGMLPNWHWETDTVENVDMANIENARAFVWNLARRMDLPP